MMVGKIKMNKEIKKEKEKMLMVLESWKLSTPSAEIRTMPSGLRKEVRNYVSTYIGRFSNEMGAVRKIKKRQYIKKYTESVKKSIVSDEKFIKKQKEFNDVMEKAKKIYCEVKDDPQFYIETTNYALGDSKPSKAVLKDSVVTEKLETEFKEIYGEGFQKFKEMLEKFEKAIEKAVLFGTIVDVYKLLEKYSKFEPFLKKLSELKVE